MDPTRPLSSPPVALAHARLGQLPRFRDPWTRNYTRSKLRLDEAYACLAELIPLDATLLDLGCGQGLLELVLEMRGGGNQIHGIEWDGGKLGFARRLLAESPRCTFSQGDLRTAPWPAARAVVLLDVLHYFTPSEQSALLRRIAEHLEPEGSFFLRVMDGSSRGRSRMTRALERLAILCRWNRAPRAHWRDLDAILADLKGLGFRIESVRTTNRLLSGNHLISAVRGADSASACPQGRGAVIQ